MLQFVIGLLAFLGIHSIAIVAPAWRDGMAARLGEQRWKGLYSIASLAAFVLLVHGYALARHEPIVLYQPPVWTRHLALLVMLPAFPLLLSAYLPGRIKTAVKHPMLAAPKTWAFAHLLANGMLADVLLFGGFLAWAVLDRISVGKRPLRVVPGAPAGRFNDVIAVIGGLLLYAIFVLRVHAWLIGVSPLP
ncbi:MAG: NnrU family protein [Gammaproteobacteria bacterium]|nr:NnrU family protein [Gammaproteobacteria bacterium]